jgi:hypothetical protein
VKYYRTQPELKNGGWAYLSGYRPKIQKSEKRLAYACHGHTCFTVPKGKLLQKAVPLHSQSSSKDAVNKGETELSKSCCSPSWEEEEEIIREKEKMNYTYSPCHHPHVIAK